MDKCKQEDNEANGKAFKRDGWGKDLYKTAGMEGQRKSFCIMI